MTKAELIQLLLPLPDEAPIAILLSDGRLDYATGAWVAPHLDDDGHQSEDAGTVIIAGN